MYKKKKIKCHFVKSLDIEEKGTPIIIHTLEGDVTSIADKDTYIMIGACSDIYPIPRTLFEKRYQVIDEVDLHKITDVLREHKISPEVVKGCRLEKDSFVYARKMEEDFAVYTKHCQSILKGKKGDYYAVSYEDTENVYVIQGDVMESTYKIV